MMASRAYVHKETTLGILHHGYMLEPLAGKVTLGGRSGMDSAFPVHQTEIRQATEADFQYFHVKSHPDYFKD